MDQSPAHCPCEQAERAVAACKPRRVALNFQRVRRRCPRGPSRWTKQATRTKSFFGSGELCSGPHSLRQSLPPVHVSREALD